jgi:hypothetical protein
MKKPGKKEVLQAASYVLCVVVAWTQADRVDGSEFVGGRVTGPIFSLFESGLLVFALAIILTFLYRRVAAVMGIAACLFCFPLYLYFRLQVRSALYSEVYTQSHSNPASYGTTGRLAEP